MTSHPSLQQIAHRPWPLPSKTWAWRQSWYELAFIHFRVDGEHLRHLIPRELEIEQFDGSAWVSIVPFRMVNFMPRNLPAIYPFRSFPELNLRTYVRSADKPGVWFFSLDADCRPLVWGARLLYGLPYHQSAMSLKRAGECWEFTSRRPRSGVEFSANYRASGPPNFPQRGTLEHWLAERYCLYSQARGRLLRLEVHHPPWPLEKAEVELVKNNLFNAAKLQVPPQQPFAQFSTGVDVISYAGEECGR